MNAQLKAIKDGDEAPRVMLTATNGHPVPTFNVLHVYWPFSLSSDDFIETRSGSVRDLFKVTHLPSGCGVGGRFFKPQALALVCALRALDLDYSFTKPKGPKWEKAKDQMKAVLQRFKPQDGVLYRYVPEGQ
jgi:hypothetical protein